MKSVNKYIIYLLMTTSLVGQTDSLTIKKIKFFLSSNINAPLLNNISLISPSSEQTTLKTLFKPIYQSNIGFSYKLLSFEALIGYTQNEFIGPSFHEAYSVYINKWDPAPTTLFDCYIYQRINYKLIYVGLGTGLMFNLNKKNNIEFGVRWLTNRKQTVITSNYFDETKPIINPNNYELIKNTTLAHASTSLGMNYKNFGCNLGYNYFFNKYFSINAGFNFMYFNYSHGGGSPGGVFTKDDAEIRYEFKSYSSLAVYVGVKVYL